MKIKVLNFIFECFSQKIHYFPNFEIFIEKFKKFKKNVSEILKTGKILDSISKKMQTYE